jgi:hypothetical protein
MSDEMNASSSHDDNGNKKSKVRCTSRVSPNEILSS